VKGEVATLDQQGGSTQRHFELAGRDRDLDWAPVKGLYALVLNSDERSCFSCDLILGGTGVPGYRGTGVPGYRGTGRGGVERRTMWYSP